MTTFATPSSSSHPLVINVVACDNDSIDLWHSRVQAIDEDDDSISASFLPRRDDVQFDDSMMFQDLCMAATTKETKRLEDDFEYMMSSSILTGITDAIDDDDMSTMDDLEVEPLPLESEPPILIFENDLHLHFPGLRSASSSSCTVVQDSPMMSSCHPLSSSMDQ